MHIALGQIWQHRKDGSRWRVEYIPRGEAAEQGWDKVQFESEDPGAHLMVNGKRTIGRPPRYVTLTDLDEHFVLVQGVGP